MQNLNIPSGLLNFCLRHGYNPEASVNPKRDPHDYEWLREALSNMESEVDKMKKIVTQIKELLQNDYELQNEKTDILLVLLEELQYFVEDLDNANELHKIGGLEPVLNLLSQSESSKVKTWCAWIIASLLQNNPKGQQLAKELNIYDTLTKELSVQNDEETRVKLISALSAYFSQNLIEIQRLILQPHAFFWKLIQESLHKTTKEKVRTLVFCQNLLQLLRNPIQDAFRGADLIVPIWNDLVAVDPESELCSKLLSVLVLLLQGNEANVKALGIQDRVMLVNKARQLKKDEEAYSTEIDNLKLLLNLVQK